MTVSHAFIRQINTLSRARAVANATEDAIDRHWRQLLSALESAPTGPFPSQDLQRQIQAIVSSMAVSVDAVVAGGVRGQAEAAYERTGELLARQLHRRMQEDIVSDIAAMVFPPPPKTVVDAIVFANGWRGRLLNQTSLGSPMAIARTVANQMAAGNSIRDIAKELLPKVNNVRSTARRIARDETMRASHAMQMQAYDQLGSMVTGYTIHAVLDQATRPEHRERNGWTYHKDPKPGERGLDQMPQPPREADGSWAYNCRCFLTPILADPVAVDDAPMDQGVLSDWFAQADEADRIEAVGAQRYQFVSSALGRKAQWGDFISGDELMSLETLRRRFNFQG